MKLMTDVLIVAVVGVVLVGASIAMTIVSSELPRSLSKGSVYNPGVLRVVVSRYAESCRWLLDPPFNRLLPVTTVYNKGLNDLPREVVAKLGGRIHALPNVGRCDHTYLYFIVKHYNRLPGLTLFLPGSLDSDETKKMSRARHMARLAPYIVDKESLGPEVDLLTMFSDFYLDTYLCADPANRKRAPSSYLDPAIVRPFGPWFHSVFGPRTRALGPILYGGVFQGTRSAIRDLPLHIWEKLLHQVGQHTNPEVGHYIERCWGTLMFGRMYEVVDDPTTSSSSKSSMSSVKSTADTESNAESDSDSDSDTP